MPDSFIASKFGDCEISIHCCVVRNKDETDNFESENNSLCFCLPFKKNSAKAPEIATDVLETHTSSSTP
jgi:hypothetical protein